MSATLTASLDINDDGKSLNGPRGLQIAKQSGLLFAGFASAQGASFVRNAMIGHWLSKGDFGIAALITVSLQLLEILSDLGVDRMILRARDGDDPNLIANAHLFLVLRGFLIAALLFMTAAPLARFFGIASTQWAFELVSVVPLIRSFTHLDARRMQRSLDNRAAIAIESVPQLIATILCLPLLYIIGSYAVVVWLAVAQALISVATSHVMARRPYQISFTKSMSRRFVQFGWPIWLSAFPLIAVYQGDRMLIGRLMGMEDLAGYAAAVMITMVPGLIVAKIAHAIMLPILSATDTDRARFAQHFKMMSGITVVVAGAYLIGFIIAGGPLLALAFGNNFLGYGNLVMCLAGMWSLRMMQAVPGMAFMADGDTRPLLYAGIIRAMALVLVAPAILYGGGLIAVALIALFGELASLAFLSWRITRLDKRLVANFIEFTSWLLPVAVIGLTVHRYLPNEISSAAAIATGMFASLATSAVILGLIPRLRREVMSYIRSGYPSR